MNRINLSVITASLLALTASVGAQTSPTDSKKPQPSVLTPMPENSSTGTVADKSASSPSRTDVKAGAKARASEKPVDQTGLTQKEKEGMSTKSRSEVKGEMKADKKGNPNMSGTDQKLPSPANDPKSVPALAPAVKN